jgi:hypothetical protein
MRNQQVYSSLKDLKVTEREGKAERRVQAVSCEGEAFC